MEYVIRKAIGKEATKIAPLLFSAMGEVICQFIGVNDKLAALDFMGKLISMPENQYSFENCTVVEMNGRIVAVTLVYDGSALRELRVPVAGLVLEMFGRDFYPEDETCDGEMYLDCIGVSPEVRGLGIGTLLLKSLIDVHVIGSNKILGLLVEPGNAIAKGLYSKLGFQVVGQKMLAGKQFEHMQLGGGDSSLG